MFKSKQLQDEKNGSEVLYICNKLIDSLINLDTNWEVARERDLYAIHHLVNMELKSLFDNANLEQEILSQLHKIKNYEEMFTVENIRMISKRDNNIFYGSGIEITLATADFVKKDSLQEDHMYSRDINGNILSHSAEYFHMTINGSTIENAIQSEDKNLITTISTEANRILTRGFSKFGKQRNMYDLTGCRYKVIAITGR